MAGLYRADADETQVLDTTAERRSLEDEAAEEEARAAALRAEKEERDRRLGMVATSQENAERELRPRSRGVGPFGSFGLFVLRLVTAGILGIVAYQVLYSIDVTAEFLSGQPLIPEPRLVSWIIGFTLAAMAVMLVIGLGVRVVGFVLAALAIAALVLIRWGSFSPFVDGMEGFLGDKDLLLAAVGILFLSMGGGRFGIDGAIHRSREDAREARRN
ncbi:DoxX family protein, partial [Tessaracoccus lubricantis]